MSQTSQPVLSSGRQLFGRDRDCEVINRLLASARAARGGALVLHGDAGVGKTALLDYATEAGTAFRVARTSGAEAEMELPFAAAAQLCGPFVELMERLPAPQRDALAVAFGRRAGAAPNQFLVGLAILGLLAEAAEQRPLICVVDDAQWLDSASALALAFVARRLDAEPVALLFAMRAIGDAFTGVKALRVQPLGRRDARALLESVLPARMDERVVERILAETQGNPLALLELPHGAGPDQLAGGFGLSTQAPVSAKIEESFTRRLAALPEEARRLLLVAAADPVGDPALLRRATERLGIPRSAADSVESAGLLTLSPRVAFRHPLVRSAVYGAALPRDRRDVHRALAEATDARTDPDRRTWHRAQATPQPDEEVAAELEHSAARAQARGGLAAAAAFLGRAVALSPSSIDRAHRALAAAQTTFEAGGFDDALDLLDIAEAEPAGGRPARARAQLLRARIAFASRRGSDAGPMLLAAARELEATDPVLARATYLEALTAATFAGRLAHGRGVVEASEAALAGPPLPEAPSPSDLLLQGLAVQAIDGYSAGAPLLKAALSAFTQDLASSPNELRWLWFANWSALFMWDDATWAVLSERHLQRVRRTGALSVLPLVLANRSSVYAFLGDLRTAARIEQELTAATEAIGTAPIPYGRLSIAALRGQESAFSELRHATVEAAQERGEGIALTVAEFLNGALLNGLGRYEDALAAVIPAERFYVEGAAIWTLTELIEAGVRCGEHDRARRAFARVEETTRAAGTDWALGIEARSRALLSDGDEAEDLYRAAIDALGRTSIRVQLARTHLLYGEWLRRERRRLDAREQLRTAYELFEDFGVGAFAERARRELGATGEHARRRSVETVDELTPQEAEIARLAADGLTNREVAARLFISASTVEYHLRKVFRKLGLKSRTQLAQRLR